IHPAAPDALLQQYGGDGRGGDRPQRIVKGRSHEHTSCEELCGRPQTGAMPSRASRRRIQPTHGSDSSTIHALPTICPSRNSSEPKASHRNTTESTTRPTTLEATTATISPRRASGVKTARSANSESRKAAAEARTSAGGASSAERAA